LAYLISLSRPERVDLDTRLKTLSILPEHFDSAERCRQALHIRLCHVLVVSLEREKDEILQLLGNSEPVVAGIPKIAVVNHADVSTAVQAIKAGADNCLERPIDPERLCTEAEVLLKQTNGNSVLTPTEEIVLRHILAGQTTRQTAQALHRSPRTVEIHRKHIMRKLGASNLVELIKIAASLGFLNEEE